MGDKLYTFRRFLGYALLLSRYEKHYEGDHDDDRDAKAALRSELAAGHEVMGAGRICRRKDRCRLRVTTDFQAIEIALTEVPDRMHRADGEDMSLTECDAGKQCRDQHQVDQSQD